MKNTSRKNKSGNNSSKQSTGKGKAQEAVSAEQAKHAEQERRAAAAEKNEAKNKQKQSQNTQKQSPQVQPSRNKNAGKKIGKNASSKPAAAEEPKQAEAAPAAPENEILYQVRTMRDSDVLKAFITFTYRVYHPRVTGRMIFYGILILVPGFFLKIQGLKIACWVIGALFILLALFRQYISLALTKNSDPDYKNRTVFTYEFTKDDASFYTGTDLTSYIKNYKEIISFYYDDKFYYMALRNKDFFILPKSRFTIGDPKEFEEFIYKKSKKACIWIPTSFSDQMKKRRAMRAMEQK
ncbi:MAG: YcxB family protein [Mogibacterium sp.]|nr:YcxB family protein [Mogibacterium sp.]